MRTGGAKSKTSPLSGPVREKLRSKWCERAEAISSCHAQPGRLVHPDAIEDQGRYRQTERCSQLGVV